MFEALPDDLASALAGATSGVARFGRLRYVVEADSTNDIALSLALAGEPEGTAVIADLQRRGRGRRGHEWFSPPAAGLYLSVIVRPQGPAGALSIVTLAAGAAVAGAVRATTALPVELKWPNDLVIGRPWRKLGGVLCEAAGVGSQVDAIVVGIGINLLKVAYPRDIAERATSIEVELGRPVERAPLVVALLGNLRRAVDHLHAQDHDAICADWRQFAHASLHGAAVTWRDREVPRRGLARDIDRDGALVVEADGHIERIIAGEVTWEGFSRE